MSQIALLLSPFKESRNITVHDYGIGLVNTQPIECGPISNFTHTPLIGRWDHCERLLSLDVLNVLSKRTVVRILRKIVTDCSLFVPDGSPGAADNAERGCRCRSVLVTRVSGERHCRMCDTWESKKLVTAEAFFSPHTTQGWKTQCFLRRIAGTDLAIDQRRCSSSLFVLLCVATRDLLAWDSQGRWCRDMWWGVKLSDITTSADIFSLPRKEYFMKWRTTSALTLACILTTCALSPWAHAQYAGSSAITDWNGSCGGSSRSWWDDMCMAWRKTMGAQGWVEWKRNYANVQMWRYTDPAVESWGNDNSSWGLDYNDAGMICTHGGWGSGQWTGTMYDQDPNGQCGLSVDHMWAGQNSGGWLRFLHLSSCNSIRYNQRTQWFDAAAGVHIVTGFHGWMYIGSQYVDEYRYLAEDAFTDRGVARAWLDNMHHVDHWYNSYKTVCPMAVGFGSSPTEARAYHDETYNSWWGNPTPNWMHTRWKAGCDPDDGPALPN